MMEGRTMTLLIAPKPAVMQKQKALLSERYDLSDRPAQGATMSRGKPLQEGVRAKTLAGTTWDSLASMTPEEVRQKSDRPIHRVLSSAAILVFAGALLSLLRSHGETSSPPGTGAATAAAGDIAAAARLLFSEHLLSFEALSVLLLAALVGAFTLARRETDR